MKDFPKYNVHKVRSEVMKIAHAIMKRGGSNKALKSGNFWGWAQFEAWKQYRAHLEACKLMEEAVVLLTFKKKPKKKGAPVDIVTRYATTNLAFIPGEFADYFKDGSRYAAKSTLFYQFAAGDNGFGLRSYKPENFVRFEIVGRPDDVPGTSDDFDVEISDRKATEDILTTALMDMEAGGDLNFRKQTETDSISGDYWNTYADNRRAI